MAHPLGSVAALVGVDAAPDNERSWLSMFPPFLLYVLTVFAFLLAKL